jgi:protein SCO1
MRSDSILLRLCTASAIAWLMLLLTKPAIGSEPGSVQLAAPPVVVLQDFALTDQLGKSRKLSDFRGAPLLVFFGFTHCPDVCPATLHRLKLLKQSPDRVLRRVQVAFISVDGERDTPEKLKIYLEPISKSFVGLTGPPKTVRSVAAQFSSVFFKGVKEKNGSYLVQHTSQVYLVDASGRLRATFVDATPEEMRAAIAKASQTAG